MNRPKRLGAVNILTWAYVERRKRLLRKQIIAYSDGSRTILYFNPITSQPVDIDF